MLEFLINALSEGFGNRIRSKHRWVTVLNAGVYVLLAVCVVLWFLVPSLR